MMQGFDLLYAGSTSFILRVSIRVWTAEGTTVVRTGEGPVSKAASVRQALAPGFMGAFRPYFAWLIS